MNVSVSITNDDGIVVRKSDDDPVGVYMGVDAPGFLAGEPNHFVGANFSDAKRDAIEHLASLAEEILDVIADLKDLRQKDVV